MRVISADQNTVVDCGETYEAELDPTKSKSCCQCDFNHLRRVHTQFHQSDFCKGIRCHPTIRTDGQYVIFKKVKPIKKIIDNRSEEEIKICKEILG